MGQLLLGLGAVRETIPIAPGATLLRGLAADRAEALLAEVERIAAASPFRRMITPGGREMSAAITNCGALGWVTDRRGYRYAAADPATGRPWPPLPASFLALATEAAARAGFEGFVPDACLVNCYEPGAKMSLHQDRDEADLAWPIVSVSLGLEATFLLGGLERRDRPLRIPLVHGDVFVFGGPARLRFHGILPVDEGHHPLAGRRRINLTLRRAGAGCR